MAMRERLLRPVDMANLGPCPTPRVRTHPFSRGLLLVAVGLLLVACASTPTPTPEVTPAPAATPAPVVTPTPFPTPTPAPTPDPEALLRELRRLAEVTADLRRLEPKSEVTQTFLSDQEMRERMRERLEEDLDPDELRAEQRVLAMLGLIEPGLDLKQLLMDLYEGQVTGYYDSEEKELVVRQSGAGFGPVERVTFVHEFTHALQDQYFDLYGTFEALRGQDNSDQRAAYRALVEGDAMLTERNYMLGYLTDDERFFMMFGAGGDPIPEETPDYILRSLLFPYLEGFDFVFSLHRRGGWDEVNRAYDNPPRSSSQVLHVDRYLEGEEPISVDLSPLERALEDAWALRRTDVLGEFSLALHLAVYLEEDLANEAAEGWRGDRYVYLEDESEEGLLVLLTRWDSVADAGFFFDAYLELVDVKSAGEWYSLQEDPGWRRWETGRGREFTLRRDGDAVLLVWAPDASATSQVQEALSR